jgi:hypothetical protein
VILSEKKQMLEQTSDAILTTIEEEPACSR